jgi:hypothetical protein
MADPPKYEFAKLELKAGDILVLKLNADRFYATQARLEGIRERLMLQLPEGVCGLVIGPEVELTAITREQAGPLVEGTAPPLKPSKVKTK